MKLPWRKYVALYETDIHKTQIARTVNSGFSHSFWTTHSGMKCCVYLNADGTWKEYDSGWSYLGTWTPVPKWVPWWKRVKPLELNKRAKKEWQRSLDTNRAPSVGRETIWGVTVTGLLGALGATTLSLLVILVLWLLSSLFL